MQLLDTSTQWLEIPAMVHEAAWQREFSLAGDRVQAYLNQVCLQTVLPWLQEKSGIEPVVDTDYPEVWELVNGCAINIGNTRLILLPTEAMDKNEFRVPQEWVDLPTWIGDYYLAVEVDTDEQWLNLWGYTTHQALKSIGAYDEHDRTYSLDESDVIQDLTVFWVMQQLPAEPTRADIPALSPLTEVQAESLIQQLANRDVTLPRLEASFAEWGALLSSTWLQQFCERRRPRTNAPVSVNLSQWVQNVFETGWQAIEELFQTEPTLAFSFRREDEPEFIVRRAKRLQVGADTNVLLVVRLDPELDQRQRIWIQVLPWQGNASLPENLSVELLSATGAVLQSVQAGSQSNYVQLKRFKCTVGTPFRLQIVCADTRIIEEFIA
ncbi:DUF1822 family protein [Phormidium sp. FACHB-592]|uniref:DUF1822 family protein n=1 Tax=Stenomitos frigidus AS-A4 TaxID=2933935 RepID=A0ABV0KQM0_9CYAN|nr:DUF1822 family protein [Phormidium sp. FACHB-592]MBD2075400.1 DUF1822 family protein [Phormidium sp. FACHB-592]